MIASLNVVTFCCERDQEHNCMHIRFKDASVAYNHPRRGHFRNSNDTYSHKTHRCIRYWSTVVVPMLSVSSNSTILYAIYVLEYPSGSTILEYSVHYSTPYSSLFIHIYHCKILRVLPFGTWAILVCLYY